ncbi:MAG TPA: alpha-ketoglutarate-dependent dioxygenase AlkB, partial [Nannocystaceae bacterium]|nr:alpha-ketoglutarate-dependent dioxygenase AlkB [Nannocystaceae bacterium]
MVASVGGQLGLFGHEAPEIDAAFRGLVRVELADGAWYDYAPGWLSGHAAMFESLLRSTDWQSSSREMYERVVEVPRLYAGIPADGPGHPAFERMRDVLGARYEQAFVRTSLALYRDGSDSVAWHGDYVARNMELALVATVSVGAARRFLLRRKGGGRSIALNLGHGDLLVMGGTIQRTWQHAIPKVARA